MGIVSPWILRASSEANVNVSIARLTSPDEYFQAFPASRQMSVASSSCRRSRISAAFRRMRDRAWAGRAE